MLAIQNTATSAAVGCGRLAAFRSIGMIQFACSIVHASQSVGSAVRKMNSASMRRRPKRSDSQPPATQANAKVTLDTRLSCAMLPSDRPSSTARFDCSAKLSAYAPHGSSATINPTVAPREPVNARQASCMNVSSSRPIAAAALPSAFGCGPRFGSFSGSTTNTVTARIAAITNR